MKLTVILRYPDYATGEWPDDTYVTTVDQNMTPLRPDKEYDAAIRKAQRKAFKAINKGRPTDEHLVNVPEDLEAIFVIEGTPMIYCPV
jgi:hypothetical protein